MMARHVNCCVLRKWLRDAFRARESISASFWGVIGVWKTQFTPETPPENTSRARKARA